MNSDKSVFSLIRQYSPVFVGVLAMFVCSVLYCLCSAVVGGFDNATGILLFGSRVGNVSRYWDPFIMGVFAGIVTYLWGKIPPIRYGSTNTKNLMLAGGAFSALVVIMILKRSYWSIFNGVGCSSGFTGCLLIIIMTPFGMRGAILSMMICSFALFIRQGLVPAVLFVTLVYLGKWINWWIFNIIRHGFTGAKSALKASGDMGMVQPP